MTPSELSALDLACAQALGEDAYIGKHPCGDRPMCWVKVGEFDEVAFSPTRDTDECMRLAGERGYDLSFRNAAGCAVVLKDGWLAQEAYTDHSGDRVAAMKVAVCRAIIASKS